MIEKKKKGGFQKGVTTNPNGRGKGTLNKSTLDYLAFRKLVVGKAEEAMAILWSAMEMGEGWAHTIYWKELVAKMRFTERTIMIPHDDLKADTTEQLAVLLKNLPRFEDYTHEELLATIKTLSTVKANESMVEHVTNTIESREDLVKNLTLMDGSISLLQEIERLKEEVAQSKGKKDGKEE